jgi:hypothetical protein
VRREASHAPSGLKLRARTSAGGMQIGERPERVGRDCRRGCCDGAYDWRSEFPIGRHTHHKAGNSPIACGRVFRLINSTSLPLLKNEWVEMGDPAPPHRRTHGGTGAGVWALVKPLPPKALAGRLGFTRAHTPARNATGGPMGCGSRPRARAKPLAIRYITHSKFNRATSLGWRKSALYREQLRAIAILGEV